MRSSRLLALAALATSIAPLLISQAHAQRSQQIPDEPFVVIDLRSQADAASTRQAFVADLAQQRSVRLLDDAGLAAALAGEASEPSPQPPAAEPGSSADANAALATARAAFDKSECPAAILASDQAIAGLAARQAAAGNSAERAPIVEGLRQAYTFILLCAHNAGDAELAMRARSRFERLGIDTAPPGVSNLIWNLYPALDATTNSHMVKLTIVTKPAGATVWIDHQEIGGSPVTTLLAEGDHLLAAALAGSGDGTASRITVKRGDGYDGDEQTIIVPVAGKAGGAAGAGGRQSWDDVADTIAAWRSGATQPSADGLGQLLTRIGARIAIVLSATKQAEIWALGPGETRARRLGNYTTDETRAIAREIARRARRWELTGPDPNVELLREGPQQPVRRRSDAGSRKSQPWWVYAVIATAVAAGGAVILFRELGSDRQRIEVEF